MQPLAKAFKPVLVSNREDLPKPQDRCPECGEVFNYVENPEFRIEESGTLPKVVLGRLAWKFIPHSKCEEKMIERERVTAEIRKRQEIAHMLKRSGFPANVMEKSLSNFHVDPDCAREFDLVKKWQPSDRFGFWLQGPPGSGKSHLMASFVHRYLEAEGVPSMVWWSVPFLFDQITKDFAREDRSEPTFNDTLQADVLFLDDLGTQQGKPWEIERLFQILDRRLNSSLPTFVTTNLASGEIKSLLHERLTSRLMGLCLPITLKSRDRRRDIFADRVRELQRRPEGGA